MTITGTEQVDAYIAALPEEKRSAMQQLREALTTAAPEAEETIAYNMPALRLSGRFFMSFDAFKNHYSLFPATDAMSDELGAELAPYVSGKGTLRFNAREPLPLELIRRIVAIRLAEFEAAG